MIAAASPLNALEPFEAPGLGRAIAAQERYTDVLLENEDVVGTAPMGLPNQTGSEKWPMTF